MARNKRSRGDRRAEEKEAGLSRADSEEITDAVNYTQRAQSELEWENRTLCGDESCIGVIGPDGRCKECGRPFEEGTEKDNTLSEPAAEADIEDIFTDMEDQTAETPFDLEWEQRALCSDESCIGVIGPDGHCKECGKKYEKNRE